MYNLIKPKDSPLCISYWKRNHNLDIGPRNWKIIQNLKENRLRVLAWKILHNIFPTGTLLLKMKIRTSDKCLYCHNQSPDSLEHFFVDCEVVKPIWAEIRALILTHVDVLIPLTAETILTGVSSLSQSSPADISLINKVVAIGRLTISKYKFNNMVNSLDLLHKELNIRDVWKNSSICPE